MKNACKQYLNRLVKVECTNGNTSTGELISISDTFFELEHRNGLKTLISYNHVAMITEIPRR